MTTKNLLLGRGAPKSEPVYLGKYLCQGVLEVHFRDQFRMWGKNMSVVLVSVDGGYVIRAVLSNQAEGVFIMSERSEQMRVFKKADTALRVCKKLGLPIVAVEL